MRLDKFTLSFYVLIMCIGIAISFLSRAADNVTLNFTGTIRGAACSVDSLSTNIPVTLGNINTTVFSNAGNVSPAVNFSIKLICPANSTNTANVTFSGHQDSTNATLLALDSGATASGVAVQLAEHDGTPINLGTNSANTPLIVGTNTLPFQARYKSVVAQSNISGGTANATAQFTINYP